MCLQTLIAADNIVFASDHRDAGYIRDHCAYCGQDLEYCGCSAQRSSKGERGWVGGGEIHLWGYLNRRYPVEHILNSLEGKTIEIHHREQGRPDAFENYVKRMIINCGARFSYRAPFGTSMEDDDELTIHAHYACDVRIEDYKD